PPLDCQRALQKSLTNEPVILTSPHSVVHTPPFAFRPLRLPHFALCPPLLPAFRQPLGVDDLRSRVEIDRAAASGIEHEKLVAPQNRREQVPVYRNALRFESRTSCLGPEMRLVRQDGDE